MIGKETRYMKTAKRKAERVDDPGGGGNISAGDGPSKKPGPVSNPHDGQSCTPCSVWMVLGEQPKCFIWVFITCQPSAGMQVKKLRYFKSLSRKRKHFALTESSCLCKTKILLVIRDG